MTHFSTDPPVDHPKPSAEYTSRKDPEDALFRTKDQVRISFGDLKSATKFAEGLLEELGADGQSADDIKDGELLYLSTGDRFKVLTNLEGEGAFVEVFGNWTELREGTLEYLRQNVQLGG